MDLKVEICCLIWLGSGKTTFLHRLVCHTQASNIRGYVMNLDPAVMTLPFGANIDIRDTVKYKEVMKQFNLGPNGGILTSLNLFATKFDEVIFWNFSELDFLTWSIRTMKLFSALKSILYQLNLLCSIEIAAFFFFVEFIFHTFYPWI